MSDPAADLTMVVEPEPAAVARAAVLDGLIDYNRQHAAPPGFRSLVIAVRDAAGDVVGGLVGETGWDWLHVDLLWVAEPYRGAGVGRRLLRAAEEEAAARGCRHSYLDTFDFQARPFYEKEGYTVFGVQDDYPPGHRRYYLEKGL